MVSALLVCAAVALWVVFLGPGSGWRRQGSSPSAGAGVLAADRNEHDFGEVRPRQQVVTVFRVENRGERRLSLLPPRTAGGALRAALSGRVLAPGKSVKLKVTLEAPATTGKLESKVTLVSERPAGHRLDLVLRGAVRSALVVAPTTLDFGVVARGKSVSRSLAVSSVNGRPFRLAGLRTDKTVYEVDSSAVGREAATHTVRVTLRPGESGGGPLVGTLRIEADGKLGRLAVPLVGRVGGQVRVMPPSLNFVAPDRRRRHTRRVVVELPGSSSFHVRAVKITKGPFAARFETEKKGRRYRVSVDFAPPGDEERAEYGGELLIETDHRTEARIRVPLSARVLKAAAAPRK
jgi:hypothetical protein